MRHLFSAVLFCVLSCCSMASAKDLFIFSAEWCPNCVQLKNAIEKDPALVVGFDVLLIDIDAEPELAKVYDVKAIPVLIVLEPNGKLRRKIGFTNSADLKKWLKTTN